MTSIYIAEVMAQIPQILSNQDRDPLSPSYGSFDRKYWGWKYKDFSDATLQCAISPLIQIWGLNIPENPYYHHELLFEWITAGVDYLFKIQHSDGGFDQCYPNERAVGNTYELFDALLIFLHLTKDKLPDKKWMSVKQNLRKACEFTLAHDEDHGKIANHFALYSYASFKMGYFFDDTRFIKKGEQLLEQTLSLQSSEGWFLEYDGADAGYETRTVYYLAKLATEFSRSDLWEPLAKSLKNFLIYCIHPDGSLGGEYGARNTLLCYPAGFEILADHFPEAKAVVKRIRGGLERSGILSLSALDPDNLIRLAANYLEAHRFLKQADHVTISIPYEQAPLEHFLPEAGLYFKSTPSYYLILNGHKGGTFRLYDKKTEKLILSDTSYGGRTKNGAAIGTNLPTNDTTISANDGQIEIRTYFCGILQQNMTPMKMIALRIAGLTVLKVDWVARLFSRYVAHTLFRRRKKYPFALRRLFTLKDQSILIMDTIENAHCLKEIMGTSFSTSIHMASSKYFCLADLPMLSPSVITREGVDLQTGKQGMLIKTRLGFEKGTWHIERNPMAAPLEDTKVKQWKGMLYEMPPNS